RADAGDDGDPGCEPAEGVAGLPCIDSGLHRGIRHLHTSERGPHDPDSAAGGSNTVLPALDMVSPAAFLQHDGRVAYRDGGQPRVSVFMLERVGHNPYIARPPRASRVLQPGMPSLPPGVERYRIPGGGAIVVGIEPGDRIAVTDVEGRQPCELVALADADQADTGVLDTRADAPA